jgi:lysozyme
MNIIDQLKFEEGLRLQAYLCPAGKKTIGYGHNLEAEPYFEGNLIPDEITKDIAEAILLHDVNETEERLEGAWHGYRKIISPARQDACLNMAFQMGVDGFMKFGVMRNYISHCMWQSSHDAALESKWAKQCPDRAGRVARQLLTGRAYGIPIT